MEPSLPNSSQLCDGVLIWGPHLRSSFVALRAVQWRHFGTWLRKQVRHDCYYQLQEDVPGTSHNGDGSLCVLALRRSWRARYLAQSIISARYGGSTLLRTVQLMCSRDLHIQALGELWFIWLSPCIRSCELRSSILSKSDSLLWYCPRLLLGLYHTFILCDCCLSGTAFVR